IKIAYSTNRGSAWRGFGPFSGQYPYYRRCYSGIDARPYYWVNQEVVYGCWHEAYYRYGIYVDSSCQIVAFDSFPIGRFILRVMPGSGNPQHNMWLPSIAVRPDNPNIIYTTGVYYDFGSGGGKDIFGWLSTDGGYNWSGPILIVSGSATVGTHDAPHIRFGTGGYLFAYFQRDTAIGPDTLLWPYYIESTDNGLTWIPRNGKSLLETIPYPRYSLWWYDYDCEVVNNNPIVALTPVFPGTHADRLEVWKGTGPVGNRTWTNTLVVGQTPPGQDSIFTFVSVVTSKDFARGQNSIGVIGYRRPGSGIAGPRLWHSTDLGNTWTYRGKLFDVGGYLDPVEFAHIVSRGDNPITDGRLHAVYYLTNDIYHHSVNVRNFITGIEESNLLHLAGKDRFKIWPNPAHNRIRLMVDNLQSERIYLKIFDPAGRMVKALYLPKLHSASLKTIDIDISSLSSGAYFVEIKTSKERILEKLIIIR
ncbi:MAG: T9SS type A sorting domain-containing protein, partial [candidate division WOR-3 bacterium]